MAQNLVYKRQLLAAKTVILLREFVESLNSLQELASERQALPEDFQDSDFETGLPVYFKGQPVRIDHLTAFLAGAVFDFGVTPIAAAYGSGSPTPRSVMLQAVIDPAEGP